METFCCLSRCTLWLVSPFHIILYFFLIVIPRFCVLLIALNIGIIAAIVDIGAIWLTNIKTGICLPAFYLSQEQCCVCMLRKFFFVQIESNHLVGCIQSNL